MFIEGFGISLYRSFGNELQLIGPFNKINFFIGQNNSGKSNIIRFLEEYFEHALVTTRGSRTAFNLSELDRHLGDNKGQIRLAFGLKHDGSLKEKLLENRNLNDKNDNTVSLINSILRFPELCRGSDIAWFIYEAPLGQPLELSNDLTVNIANQRTTKAVTSDDAINVRDWAELLSTLANRRANQYTLQMVQDALQYILQAMSPAQLDVPPVTVIQAIREIKSDSSKDDFDYSGLNIIKELIKLERPDLSSDYYPSKERFESINRFVRGVLGKPDARLEIPASENTIHVQMDDKTLPLENLGTGIHEVIILAIVATLLQDQIVCIEEPEIHLHPLVQRKLIQYLAEHTSNQYFITTHSASMIDIPNAAVFHVQHDGQQSFVKPVFSSSDRFSVCVDLGYRASDILQANCIIWVEGPSDRIYLKHWLQSYDPELEEGIHYSIMFYGGRLLSHLSANDEEVEEFISLRRINQNLAILIDSDREKKGQVMNATKRRIRNEFQEGPGFAWVTKGREIENYIPSDLMLEAIQAIYTSVCRLASTKRYDRCYHYVTDNNRVREKSVDKVKLARKIAQTDAVLDILDLEQRIRQVAHFIRQCNDLKLQ